MRTGTSAPSGCRQGEFFFDTDATPGQNIYACTADGVWTLQAGAGGSGSIATTSSVLKGDNAGAAIAAVSGTDYVAPAGNVATATALASNPTDCSTGNTFANIIAASGNLTCDYERLPANAQTGTTYTVLSTDLSKFLTFSNASAIAVTLPQATGSFADGYWFFAKNIGAGAVTITPTTSTINGAATLVLDTGEFAIIRSDGTNYEAATNRLIQSTNMTITKGRSGATLASSGSGSVATTSSTLKGDGAGGAVAVTGTSSDCVKVDGSSGSCGGTADIGLGTSATTTVITVAAGNASIGDTTSTFTAATVTKSAGTDTGNWVTCVAYNAGTPRLEWVYGAGITVTNYTLSGITGVSGSACPANSHQLGSGSIASGSFSTTVTDTRAGINVSKVVVAGTGISSTVAARTITNAIDTAVVAQHSDTIQLLSSVAGTNTITASVNQLTSYANGVCVRGRPANDNTGSATLNVNSIGAKTIYKLSSGTVTALSSGDLDSESDYIFCYNTAYNASAGGWQRMPVEQGSASSGFDIFSASSYELLETFPNANSTSLTGALRWTQGGNNCSSAGGVAVSERYAPGGVQLTTSAGSGDDCVIVLHANSSANTGLLKSVCNNATCTMEFWFKTPASVTNHSFQFGLSEEAGTPFATRDGITLRYLSGTDSAWLARQNYTTTPASCTASAAPANSTYYVLRISTAASTTTNVSLYASTTSYAAAKAGSDLFSSCSGTMTDSAVGYSPFIAVQTETTAAASVAVHRWALRVAY